MNNAVFAKTLIKRENRSVLCHVRTRFIMTVAKVG